MEKKLISLPHSHSGSENRIIEEMPSLETIRTVADAMKQGYAYKQNTNALGQNTEIQNITSTRIMMILLQCLYIKYIVVNQHYL